jgi:CRISPR-associated protein Csx3
MENKKRKVVFWNIEAGVVTPVDPLPEMPKVERGSILVIGGRSPVWRYGMALHVAHGCSAGAIATYDPRLGAVVVASHVLDIREGQILDVEFLS